MVWWIALYLVTAIVAFWISCSIGSSIMEYRMNEKPVEYTIHCALLAYSAPIAISVFIVVCVAIVVRMLRGLK